MKPPRSWANSRLTLTGRAEFIEKNNSKLQLSFGNAG